MNYRSPSTKFLSLSLMISLNESTAFPLINNETIQLASRLSFVEDRIKRSAYPSLEAPSTPLRIVVAINCYIVIQFLKAIKLIFYLIRISLYLNAVFIINSCFTYFSIFSRKFALLLCSEGT